MLTTLLVIFQDSQMPLELRQPPPVPQPVNQTESGLEQAQHRPPQVVYQAVLARGDSIGSPQQQPDIDQGQRQQQPSQAFPMLQARQFQPEAPAIIFVVFEHLLDLEALAVAGTSPLPVGLRGQQIPRLLAPPVPVHRQVETTNGVFLGESYIRPKVALSRTQGWQHLEPLSPFPAHILLGPQPQAEAPVLAQGPLGQNPSAKLPVAQQDHLGSLRHPASYCTQDFPLLSEAGSPWVQHLPQQRQCSSPPADAHVEDVEGVPLCPVQDQQHTSSSSYNPPQNPLGQRELVDFHLDTRVLQEALHPFLEGIPASLQRGTGHHLPHLEAAAPENPNGHPSQVDHPGFWFCRQIISKLLHQVGKERVLCFNHGCLRCCGVCGRYVSGLPTQRQLLYTRPLTSGVPYSALTPLNLQYFS